MALLSKKEFSDKCGIKSKDLSNYIKRGKVVLSDDRIDDANAMNIAFMEKCLKRPKKEQKEVENAVAPPHGDKDEKKVISKVPTRPKDKKTPDKYDERFDLDTEKRRAEIKKLDRESQLADVKHEKAMGKLTPTDVTRSLFIQTIKNFTVTFKQAADKVVQEFAKRTRMNRNDIAAMKGELILAINHASENAVMESQKGVSNIVREYSEAKEL